jgi:hypothetical protein
MTKARILDKAPHSPGTRRFGWSGDSAGPGLLVEFQSPSSASWIGDFAPGGWTGHSSIVPFVDGRRLLVLAGGIAYLVDPERMTVDKELSDLAVDAYLAEARALVILNWHDLLFEGHDANGLRWRTRRVSYDGIERVAILENQLVADTWSAPLQQWIPVTVDLATGKAIGGAYDLPDAVKDEQLYLPE